MTEDEVIRRAREWAAERGHTLDNYGFAVPFESVGGCTPQERKGWWMVAFASGEVLCGGGPHEQLLWVNDATGQVDWPRMPSREKPSWWRQLLTSVIKAR